MCRVNVFKPGTGTITVWENTGGTRGAVLYQKKGIPLTPGPLMVVIKVASSQVANATGYWPPALPDSIETIAASYVESSVSSKLRLFNLSPVRAKQSTESAACDVTGHATFLVGLWMRAWCSLLCLYWRGTFVCTSTSPCSSFDICPLASLHRTRSWLV